VISGFDITTVTINPLNYKQMILADQLLSGASWNVTALDGLVAKLVGAIQARMPNITYAAITDIPNVPTTTSGKAPINLDTNGDGVTDVTIDIDNDILQPLITAVNNGIKPSQLNSMIQSIISPYNSIKTASTAGVMNRVNNYLNNVSKKLLGAFDNAPCWKLTEPTLLFESREGIGRMYPFTDADGSMKFAAGKYTFIMTSLTEEYIVPVYRKYIALIYGGKVKQCYSFGGNQLARSFIRLATTTET